MKKIDVKQVLLAYFKFKSIKNNRIIFREIIHCFCIKYLFEFEVTDNLFINSVNRYDLDLLFNKIYDSCEHNKSKCTIMKKKAPNILNLISFICNFFPFITKINKIYKLNKDEYMPTVRFNFFEKLYIFLRLLEAEGMKRSLSKLDFSNIKNLIVFCDAYPPEYIFVNEFNRLNKETITCQHAIFRPFQVIDSVHSCCTYKVYAKKLLSWGNDTKEFFRKSMNSFIVCGNPVLKNEIICTNNPQKIGVILDIPSMYKWNCKMLKTVYNYANEHNYVVVARLHPTDSILNYDIRDKIQFENNLDDSNVIIGNTSSMIFTYLAQNKKVLKYNTPILYYSFPSEIVFNNEDELNAIMNHIDKIDFKKICEKQISYVGDDSKRKYKKFFDSIN